jgi:hypothetical protein
VKCNSKARFGALLRRPPAVESRRYADTRISLRATYVRGRVAGVRQRAGVQGLKAVVHLGNDDQSRARARQRTYYPWAEHGNAFLSNARSAKMNSLSLGRSSIAARIVVIAGLFAVLLSGCADLFGPKERVVMMDVAPQRVSCMGVGPQECLRVRQHPETAWTLFYGGIEGFQFEEGFEYTIRVAVRRVRNPPVDGSSLAYRLLQVVRKVPAEEES